MFTYNFTTQHLKQSQKFTFINLYDDYLKSKDKKSSIAESTKKQSRIMRNKFFNFLIDNNKTELTPEQITADFLNDFFSHVRGTTKTTSTYHRNIYYELSRVFDYAMKKGILKENVMIEIDLHTAQRRDLFYLTPEHLNYLAYVKINPYMRTVIDIFLIQCYTGFAYADLMQFDYKKHYVKENNGKDKIIIDRVKTKITCIVPVLPRVKAILRKYDYKLPRKNYDYYLTMLDVVGSILNLPFKLTTHVGRKTAGVYLLNEGVSIEVVSAVLGHASVLTTQKTYTTILNRRIDKEFENLY